MYIDSMYGCIHVSLSFINVSNGFAKCVLFLITLFLKLWAAYDHFNLYH